MVVAFQFIVQNLICGLKNCLMITQYLFTYLISPYFTELLISMNKQSVCVAVVKEVLHNYGHTWMQALIVLMTKM